MLCPAQKRAEMNEGAEARVPGEEVDEQVGEGLVLSPWEQHSSVINLPRFDYRTPALLLERSYSGFLITCPIKREKSATKEAILILEQLCSWSSISSESLDSSDCNVAIKKRKISSEENSEEHASSTHENDLNNMEVPHDKNGKETNISRLDASEMMTKQLDLSLVKLTRSGLILFTFTPSRSVSAVNILSRIFQSLGSGDLKKPLWCHRIFPIQETCILKDSNLSAVVSKLVRQYLSYEQSEAKSHLKFAVGYNRRGLEQNDAKGQKSTAEVSKLTTLLDRDECFKIVAKAVKDIIEDSVVDLKSPEIVVLVELLPISGVALESAVAGVSVLPQDLVGTKPRLTVRALTSDGKTTGKDM